MTFLHASLAAAGLACIAIPIIIHLLMHRRRKPVMWGAMRFLLEAYRRQRRRLMLEKWLLLLCRCLVVALLALAIGRPLVGRLIGPRAGHTLYVLIDNSLTSGVRSADGSTALERHKATARAAIEAFRTSRLGSAAGGEGDRVGLVTLGSPPEGLVVPASADLSAVTRLIDEIEPTDSPADFSGALELVAAAIGRAGRDGAGAAPASTPQRTYVAVLSEFREGSIEPTASAPPPAGAGREPAADNPSARLPDGVVLLAAAPGEEPRTNTGIFGVEPLRTVVISGRPETLPAAEPAPGAAEGESSLLRVLLRRSGADLAPAATVVRARIAWPDRGPGSADQPGAQTQATVKWSQGQESAMAVVSLPAAAMTRAQAAGAAVITIDDDALPADNTWRRPVEFRESLRVGIIAPTVYAGGSGVSPDKLDPGSWARFALAPSVGTGIETVDIEPASLDAARLAGLDAVVLPRPDLVQDSAWARIGLFAAGGGVVVVMPPPSVPVHLWSDAMIRHLGLPEDWSLPREAQRVDGAALRIGPAAAPPAEASATPAPASARLLALVEGELEELLRPVSTSMVLAPQVGGDAGQVVLRLESGQPVLWVGRPRPPSGTEGRGQGLIVYLAVALSLDWTDLPARPLMVPLMQEIVRQGVGEARGQTWITAGQRPSWLGGNVVELRRLNDQPGSARRTPSSTPVAESQSVAAATLSGLPPLRRAGLFQAVDDRGAARGLLAVNPDPRAARVMTRPKEVVAAMLVSASGGSAIGAAAGTGVDRAAPGVSRRIVWLPPSGSVAMDTQTAEAGVGRVISGLLGSAQQGSPIDLPLLIAALVLAVIEVGLARWASHAEVVPDSVRRAAGAVTAGVMGDRGAGREGAAA